MPSADLQVETRRDPRRPGRGRRVVAALAATVALTGCKSVSQQPEPTPQTRQPLPSQPTNTIKPELTRIQKQACTQQDLEEVGPSGYFLPPRQPECEEYADELFDKLGHNKQYAELSQVTGRHEKVKHFQSHAGIHKTYVLNQETFATMAQEAERLQKPTYTIDCNNTASHATWSRSELVDRLAQRNAFSVQYDTSGSAPRTDLLNPALSNDTVIRRLGEVTGFGWCNNFNFDVLLVTSGHSENTLGGHRSQHTDGDAFDFRPKNGEVSMPAAALPEGNTLQPENYIVNNPAATAAAVAILGFMDSVPNKYHQVITSDLAGNINEGHVLPGNYDWGAKTESTHLEHIHAGVNPAYQG